MFNFRITFFKGVTLTLILLLFYFLSLKCQRTHTHNVPKINSVFLEQPLQRALPLLFFFFPSFQHFATVFMVNWYITFPKICSSFGQWLRREAFKSGWLVDAEQTQWLPEDVCKSILGGRKYPCSVNNRLRCHPRWELRLFVRAHFEIMTSPAVTTL